MKLFTSFTTASVMILSMLTTSANAQDINLLPEGQTLITLSVTERVKVEQDTLIATLRIERENQDAETLQREINAAMTDALDAAKSVDAIKVSTGHYSVYQYNNQPQGGRADNLWRGSQAIILEGMDTQAILKLAGEIQAMGFVMSQLNYTLSTEKADEVRNGLMETAIKRAQADAQRAAQAMGKMNVDIATLNINESLGYSQPVMRARDMAMSAMAESAPPVADAGETEVTLIVQIQAVAK